MVFDQMTNVNNNNNENFGDEVLLFTIKIERRHDTH